MPARIMPDYTGPGSGRAGRIVPHIPPLTIPQIKPLPAIPRHTANAPAAAPPSCPSPPRALAPEIQALAARPVRRVGYERPWHPRQTGAAIGWLVLLAAAIGCVPWLAPSGLAIGLGVGVILGTMGVAVGAVWLSVHDPGSRAEQARQQQQYQQQQHQRLQRREKYALDGPIATSDPPAPAPSLQPRFPEHDAAVHVDLEQALGLHTDKDAHDDEATMTAPARPASPLAPAPQAKTAPPPPPSLGRPWCHVCELVVTTDALHCRSCNKCVRRLDHHCYLLNTCIGASNLRVFRATLFLTTAYLAFLVGVFLVVAVTLHTSTARRVIGAFAAVLAAAALAWVGWLAKLHAWTLPRAGLTTLEYGRYLRDRERARVLITGRPWYARWCLRPAALVGRGFARLGRCRGKRWRRGPSVMVSPASATSAQASLLRPGSLPMSSVTGSPLSP